MAAVSLIVFVSLFFTGYFTRNNGGVPLPVKYECERNSEMCWKRFDIWGHIVGGRVPQSGMSIVLKNLSTWFVVYTVAHILTHVKPQRRLFKPFKFNPNYPSLSLVGMEILRSVRGVLITSIYEIMIQDQHLKKNLPILELPTMFQLSCPPSGGGTCDLNLFAFLFLSILVYYWGDLHFYWTHRMLHTKWLYKNVHKVHHESYNPDPFSGLSMHWFESSVYFSAAPLISFVIPLHSYRLLTLGLILMPLGGHSGFGSWKIEQDYNHYIHHSKFNWNYGSSPMWDHLMGTNYKPLKSSTSNNTSKFSIADDQRAKEAEEQASLVGAAIGKDMMAISSKKRINNKIKTG